MVFSEKGLDGVHWLVGEEMVLVGAICIGGGNAIAGSDWYLWKGLVLVGERLGIGGREMGFFSYYLQVTIYIYNFTCYDFTCYDFTKNS